MTNTRLANGWLLFLLPIAGFGVGYIYHHYGGRAKGGNALVIDEVHNDVDGREFSRWRTPSF